MDDDIEDAMLLEDEDDSELKDEGGSDSQLESESDTNDDSTSLVKGNKSEVLAALAKAKESTQKIFGDDD